LAWLNATPEAPAGSRQNGKRQPRETSRLRRLTDAGAEPPLPPIQHAHRLLSLFIELGMAGASGMGAAPLSWSEIAQWQSLTAQPLQPWEARALRMASVEYVGQLHQSTDPACPPPWSAMPTEDDRQRVASGLRQMLSANAKRG
jgi:hypothetical protein